MENKPDIQHDAQEPSHRPPGDEPERIGEGELDPVHTTTPIPHDYSAAKKTDQLNLPGVDLDIAESAVRIHPDRLQ